MKQNPRRRMRIKYMKENGGHESSADPKTKTSDENDIQTENLHYDPEVVINREKVDEPDIETKYFDAESDYLEDLAQPLEDMHTPALSVEIKNDRLEDIVKGDDQTTEKVPVCDSFSKTDEGSLKCDTCHVALRDEDSFVIHQTNYNIETKFKSYDELSVTQKSESLDSIGRGGPDESQVTKFRIWMLSNTKTLNENSPRKRVSRDDNSFEGRFLTICPVEMLEFFAEDDQKEPSECIVLKNIHPFPVAYIIRTTAPDHFIVSPCSGCVKPYSCVEVRINIRNGYENEVNLDKFLIVAVKLDNEPQACLADLWKDVPSEEIMEHRLSCKLSDGPPDWYSDMDQLNEGENESSKKIKSLYGRWRGLTRLCVMKLFFFLILLLGVLGAGLFCWYLFDDREQDNDILDEIGSGESPECLYGVCTKDCL